MKKCILIVLALFFLTACDKSSENENYTIQASPTNCPEIDKSISNENNTIQASPTNGPEIDKSITNANNTIQISPTNYPVIDKSITEDITTPILVKKLFMGGISNGKWMQPEEFYNSGAVNFDGFEYNVYSFDGLQMGTAIGGLPTNWMSGEPIQGDKYEEGYIIVELYDKNNQVISYDIALKADWDLFPRTFKEQTSHKDNYINLVKSYLKECGLENPDTSIKQVINVDLEGDGTEEMLISADNTTDDQFEEVKKGDNAVIIFRKIVDGEAYDQIVEQDIRLTEEEYPSLYRLLFRVETVADLDGDSVMEVIVRNWYYEGEGWSIYKLINNRLELVAANGLGA